MKRAYFSILFLVLASHFTPLISAVYAKEVLIHVYGLFPDLTIVIIIMLMYLIFNE